MTKEEELTWRELCYFALKKILGKLFFTTNSEKLFFEHYEKKSILEINHSSFDSTFLEFC